MCEYKPSRIPLAQNHAQSASQISEAFLKAELSVDEGLRGVLHPRNLGFQKRGQKEK